MPQAAASNEKECNAYAYYNIFALRLATVAAGRQEIGIPTTALSKPNTEWHSNLFHLKNSSDQRPKAHGTLPNLALSFLSLQNNLP